MEATEEPDWDAILQDMDNALLGSQSLDPVVPQDWPSGPDNNSAIISPAPSQSNISTQLQHIPITREEFIRELESMRGTFEEMHNLQLQAVTRDHSTLTVWTLQVNETMEDLAGKVRSSQASL
ncbi:hypothetical protein ACEPPN_006482 [Leptodophora sp. 'Broadleaf-Isolate-01']